MRRLSGAITALVTPFNGDELDAEGFVLNIRDQLRGGVQGLVIAGSTGEDPTLTSAERRRLITLAVQEAKGHCPIIVGCGTNSTRKTIDLVIEAKQLGADMAIIILPYYNRPTQEGLLQHIETVADAVDLPIILYNHPGRTGINMLPECLERIGKLKTVIGLKDCSGSALQIAQYLIHRPHDRFSILSGDDNLTLPYMALGADGVISVVANLVPEKMVAFTEAILAGHLALAQQLHRELWPLFEASCLETNPMSIKAMMEQCGKAAGKCRLPLCDLRADTRQKITHLLQTLNLAVVGSCSS